MAAPGICPQCGERLPADMPHGVCPRCMLRLGFEEVAAPSGQEQPTTDQGMRFRAPSPAALADCFPQLEILELVGQGGMGAVYRARQKSLDRIVALKVLPPQVGSDSAFAERFAREARALAQLAHPHIVTVFDFGQADGYFYFLMEYVDGVNLRQSLSTGHLTPQQALAIVPQICEALQYAHDQGVVHRDIKPENVLLDKRGQVKIADFGLAKLLGQQAAAVNLTGTGQVMGTPHYMAPEQLERPSEVDHRADIYSLGVVFYELLTGQLPLGRFAPPSRTAGVPADLDHVVMRALEREPAERYQQASEVKTAVQTVGSAPRTQRAPDRPPVVHALVDLEAAEDAVRGPATCLLILGILSCLTSLLLPLAVLLPSLLFVRTDEIRVTPRVELHDTQVVWAPVEQVEDAGTTQVLPATEAPNTESRDTQVLPLPVEEGEPVEQVEDAGTTQVLPASEAPVLPEIERAVIAGSTSPSATGVLATPRKAVILLLLLVPLFLLNVVMAIVIIVGSLRMRRLLNWDLSLTASILAALPIHPWSLIGIPLGIWSVYVLTRPETRTAFRLRKSQAHRESSTSTFRGGMPAEPKPTASDPLGGVATLRTPAALLVAVGAGNLGAVWLVGFYLFLHGGWSSLPVMLYLLVLPLLVSCFQMAGGLYMLRCTSYAMANIGALAAILPLSALWFVAMPVGIWALIVLQRHEVRLAFAGAAWQREEETRRRGGGRIWPLLLLLLLLGLVGGGLVAAALWFLAARSAPVQVIRYGVEEAIIDQDHQPPTVLVPVPEVVPLSGAELPAVPPLPALKPPVPQPPMPEVLESPQ